MSMYSVKGLKREYTQTSGISYEVSEDTSNIGGTYLQAKFSEIGIQPMTFKKLVSIIGAPTDIMFGDEKSEYTWAIEGKRYFYNPQLECDSSRTFRTEPFEHFRNFRRITPSGATKSPSTVSTYFFVYGHFYLYLFNFSIILKGTLYEPPLISTKAFDLLTFLTQPLVLTVLVFLTSTTLT